MKNVCGDKKAFLTINLITLFRIVAAPVLLYFIFTQAWVPFKWLLLVAFLTDLVDGELARRFKVTSILGSRLDSIGDDLTVLCGVVGMIVRYPEFIREELALILIRLFLFLCQLTMALIRYKKISSFHTYGAKLAAFAQGLFLLSSFFFEQPSYVLFYFAAFVTIAELIEEIILVMVLPKWEANVKGLYWVLKKRR